MILGSTVVGIFEREDGVEAAVLRATRSPRLLRSSFIASEGGREATIHRCLETISPLPVSHCYVALPERQVFRKILELSEAVREEEVPLVIKSEVASFLPEDPETMEVRYQVLPHPSKRTYAVVTAVQRDVVNALLEVLATAKLTVRAIDTAPAAALRALVAPRVSWDSRLLATQEGSGRVSGVLCAVSDQTVLVSVHLGGATLAASEVRIQGDGETDASRLLEELHHLVKFSATRLALDVSLECTGLSLPSELEALVRGGGEIGEILSGSWISRADSVTVPAVASGAGLFRLFSGDEL